jgi:hypothetical protein
MVTELDAITEGYNQVSSSLLDDAGRLANNSFKGLGSWRDDDISRFVDTLAPALMGVKAKSAQVSIAYGQKVAELAGKKFVAPSVAALDLSTKALRNGANTLDVYSRPFVQMRMALAKGESFTDALNTGAMNSRQLARTEIQLSRRKASLYARKANDNVVGYLRTLTGSESCALCYTASTQRYNKGDLMPIHPGCDCGEMPIYGDTDTGQVIDQQLLDKSHEAVEDRFGFSDLSGKTDLDYRKIMVRDHGEIGPMLTVKGHKFIGPNNLDLVGKKMPLPPVLPPVSERVQKIKDKAGRIFGADIASDIKEEFKQNNEPAKRIPARNVLGRSLVPAGVKAEKALDDVVALGKEVDDELSIRVKARIDEVGQKYQVEKVKTEIKVAKVELEKLNADVVGFNSQMEGFIEAHYRKRIGTFYTDEGLAAYKLTDEYTRNLDKMIAQNQDYLEGRIRAKDAMATKVKAFEDTLNDQITPGSVAYDTIQREEFRKLLAEVRETGGGTRPAVTSKIKKDVAVLEQAFDEYPTAWVNTFQAAFPDIALKKTSRGRWTERGPGGRPELRLSGGRGRLGDVDTYDTAVHELGHGFEDSIPGLKPLEYAMYMRRAKSDNYEYTRWAKGEYGSKDEWREPYSGRDYGATPTDNFEIFTTGVESLLGGSGYFGDVIKNQTVDTDFRRFILGVLVGL